MSGDGDNLSTLDLDGRGRLLWNPSKELNIIFAQFWGLNLA